MDNYIIFERTRTESDPRRRWHKRGTMEAESPRDALVKSVVIRDDYLPLADDADACMTADGRLVMAEREDQIDFEHYNFDGTFVEVA